MTDLVSYQVGLKLNIMVSFHRFSAVMGEKRSSRRWLVTLQVPPRVNDSDKCALSQAFNKLNWTTSSTLSALLSSETSGCHTLASMSNVTLGRLTPCAGFFGLGHVFFKMRRWWPRRGSELVRNVHGNKPLLLLIITARQLSRRESRSHTRASSSESDGWFTEFTRKLRSSSSEHRDCRCRWYWPLQVFGFLLLTVSAWRPATGNFESNLSE
jgi:hypothetical protein